MKRTAALFLSLLATPCFAAPAEPLRSLAIGTKTEAPCPDPATTVVIGAFGQSNAGNHLSSPMSARPDLPAYMALDGKCYLISDPVLGASNDRTANQGSVWARVAFQVAASLNRPVLVIAAGSGGYTVRDWLTDQWGAKTFFVNQINQMATLGFPIEHYVWLQGESDTLASTTGPNYQSRLTTLITSFAVTSPGMTFWTGVESYCLGKQSAAIRQAQINVATNRADTFSIKNFDTYGDDKRRDRCHFNATGAGLVAKDIADDIIAVESAPATALRMP